MVQIKHVATLFKLGLLAGLLAGCAGPSPVGGPPVYDRSSGDTDGNEVVAPAAPEQGVAVTPAQRGLVIEQVPEAPVAAPVRQVNPAVVALLDTAAQQQRQGATGAASSSLERAQRIAPRDPEVYYRLADIRRVEKQWYQAEQLALRGTDLAIGDTAMLRRLWLLIADIRTGAGNAQGAGEARNRASRY
ncbi:hypothetical protein ACFVYJ_05480 [Pontibacter sp. JAM-7]|uniref:hypothetical protein n=1 Tax=Pontibacter sp. JAM-7 TaxID=3366581 RepID=UPI003AF56E32